MPECKIPTAEVKQDIEDTRREIADLERQMEGHRLVGDRMSIFRADAAADGIRRRQEFIEKLEAILKDRGELT